MNLADIKPFIDSAWRDDIVPRLVEYVRVPAKSPAFDPDWASHGHLSAVVRMAEQWALKQPGKAGGHSTLAGMKLEVVQLQGRTPVIFFDVPATGGLGSDRTVLFYGHLDKQPEMTGWREDLGPWKPVIEDGRLYGRGSADDGYAIFAALTAIAALDSQAASRPRCVGLIETCEESGSYDLPAYLEALAPRMGQVQLVVGLDSGCGNYEQLWVTTSLRGLIGGALAVEVLSEGVHSGAASGLVPSSFRVARRLLDRIDDSTTGTVRSPVFHAQVPDDRQREAQTAGAIIGDQVWQQFPWVGCSHDPAGHPALVHSMPTTTDPVEGILNRTWRPALSVVGAAGLPAIGEAGNVLRPRTLLKLSMRLPPTVDGERASHELKKLLEADAPYNARVTFEPDCAATGWNAPPTAPGEGGTIPFMNMLGQWFPDAQFLITGVLGPRSNAHGPNEFLHIPYATALTRLVAAVVAATPA